ncbi:hypothetical protein ACR79N_00565 [Sphingobacterium siyangense]|uniref:Endosialidase-like protein n=1 Tax=Sphingobacterium siyangense TaxID=459529 RepID=A0A562M2T9_9SPHI|nr:hypothetical protein [Sphingobacterium siyangense]TWI13921.1 hypothetical protein IQ31_05470 [Sphingobacterium siyangense]
MKPQYFLYRLIMLIGAIFIIFSSGHLSAQTAATASVSTAGWKRVAYVNNLGGRGFGKVTLFTSGGSNTPNYLDIEWFKDWLTTGGISVKTNSNAGYWSGARLTYDKDTTFIEVNFTVAIANLQLLNDTYGWNVAKLYSGALPDGGGTVRAEAARGRLNVDDKFYVGFNGRVGIGTSAPQETLSVNGKIRAQEVKIETANWPDYVFADGYQLPTLKETAVFIEKNKHLPGVPKAAEVEENGQFLGEMNKILLQKIEEITLHLIEQQQQIKDLQDRINVYRK